MSVNGTGNLNNSQAQIEARKAQAERAKAAFEKAKALEAERAKTSGKTDDESNVSKDAFVDAMVAELPADQQGDARQKWEKTFDDYQHKDNAAGMGEDDFLTAVAEQSQKPEGLKLGNETISADDGTQIAAFQTDQKLALLEVPGSVTDPTKKVTDVVAPLTDNLSSGKVLDNVKKGLNTTGTVAEFTELGLSNPTPQPTAALDDLSPTKLSGATKALGALGLASAFVEFGKAVSAAPPDWVKAVACLGDAASALGSMSETLSKIPALAALGGIGNIIAGIQGLAQNIQNIQQNGADAANVMGTVASSLKLMAGVSQIVGMIPGCQVMVGVGMGLTLAAAAVDLAAFIYSKREAIANGAQAAWEWLSGGPSEPTDSPQPQVVPLTTPTPMLT